MDTPLAPEAREVLDFWFGGDAERGRMREAWFRKSDAFDREIEQRFGALVDRALEGELAGWAGTAEGALAQIVVLDQFTRNIHRGTAKAFAGDAQALPAAQALLASGQDAALLPSQRLFAYLPLEHAEDLQVQDESVRLFGLLQQASPDAKGLFDYALKHREVIARFGRFPHRNAALGRESTAEERRYIEQPGSGF
jgi:uncharacterized protein (DUF924 family)